MRAIKSAKVSNHSIHNCRLIVQNLLLRTKVAPDNVPQNLFLHLEKEITAAHTLVRWCKIVCVAHG